MPSTYQLLGIGYTAVFNDDNGAGYLCYLILVLPH